MALREIDGGRDYYSQFSNPLPTDINYFPIGVWLESVQSQADIDMDKAAGLNLYVGITRNSQLSLVQANGMDVILQADEWLSGAGSQEAIANPAVVGWLLYDEIDMVAGPPDGDGYNILNDIIASLPDDGRMMYNNYGKGVMMWETDEQAARFINDFQDVSSADVYWFTDPNMDSVSPIERIMPDNGPWTQDQLKRAANYGYVVDRMRMLDAMDGERQPIWNFVEVGWPFTESAAQGGRAIEPEEINAAVWHSLIAGAQGIIYFNHSFGGPLHSQHVLRDVPYYADVRAQVTETNALIHELAPVLNSPFDDGFVTASPTVRVMAKFYEGVHYVFAGSIQYANAPAHNATFTMPSVSGGTATVINEGRTISITGGQFLDNFANGNAIHIYKINTGGTQIPGAPTIGSFLTDSNVVGDGITNDNTLTLTGTALANSTVTVFDGTNQIGTTTANGSGAWGFTTSPLPNGSHSFTVTATIGGTTGPASSPKVVTVDTVAPSAPVIASFSSDTGTVGDGITSDTTLTLAGSAAANSTVTIFDGTNQIGTTTANGSGAWGVTTSPLPNGSHNFTATATDVAGNTSVASPVLAVTVDTVPPSAPAITSFSSDTGTVGDGITSDTTLTLAGSAAANSAVAVFDGAIQIGTTSANASGAWDFTTSPLPNGNHSFTATATDVAGNTSVASPVLAVTVDTVAPSAPAIVSITFVLGEIPISTSVFLAFAALQETLSDVGQDVVFALDAENSITLRNTSFASMMETDFLFV